jgi:NitT/TauT family transport system substrate-binding protein
MTDPVLRLNEGDPSETRLYYLPHYVAAELGYFRQAGIDVVFTRTATGGHTVRGGQIPAVVSGEADLTIGGPMVTMKMLEEGNTRLVSICAAVRTHPWFLLARRKQPDFNWSDLAGCEVIDIANIGTASFTFRALLEEQGLGDSVRLTPGIGGEEAALRDFVAGAGDYAIQQLHSAGPRLADGSVHAVRDLATATGGIPWSAYIALPDVVRKRAGDFRAFTQSIERAFAWIAAHPGNDVAALVGMRFGSYPRDAMATAIDLYKAVCLWPQSGTIPREDFERFGGLLTQAGWLQRPAPYDDLVRSF